MKHTCEKTGIAELIADLIDREICLWWQNRLTVGVLRGVGDGLLCVDLKEDIATVRTFIPVTAISAFRAAHTD